LNQGFFFVIEFQQEVCFVIMDYLWSKDAPQFGVFSKDNFESFIDLNT
jgi:hypothetical protein